MKRLTLLTVLLAVFFIAGLVTAQIITPAQGATQCHYEAWGDPIYDSPVEGHINYYPLEKVKQIVNPDSPRYGWTKCLYSNVPYRVMRFYAPHPTFTPEGN